MLTWLEAILAGLADGIWQREFPPAGSCEATSVNPLSRVLWVVWACLIPPSLQYLYFWCIEEVILNIISVSWKCRCCCMGLYGLLCHFSASPCLHWIFLLDQLTGKRAKFFPALHEACRYCQYRDNICPFCWCRLFFRASLIFLPRQSLQIYTSVFQQLREGWHDWYVPVPPSSLKRRCRIH